jgi:hypothetical protein
LSLDLLTRKETVNITIEIRVTAIHVVEHPWAGSSTSRLHPVPRQNIVHPQNEGLGESLDSDGSDKILAMIVPFRYVLGWVVRAFSSREDLILENLALRQQLLALHAKRPRRRLTAMHKLFWVAFENVLVGVDEASRPGYS